jgi:hypothetical protein
MPGGQGGLSWLGEGVAATAAATAALLLVTQLWLGCIGMPGSNGSGGGMAQYDQECIQTYADANDGNDDTKVETAILEQPDCRAAVAAMKAERQAKQMEQVQEAQP